jgi:dTDP-4-dehydrorhamnose 3,5-epimerase-like enzyme
MTDGCSPLDGFPKVSHRRLVEQEPPLVAGGRLRTPAGEIAQVVNGDAFRFLVYLEFVPGPAGTRGRHYHNRRVELLYVIRGSLRAVYVDLTTSAVRKLALSAGDLVMVQPRCAHAYTANEYTQALELSASPYDPDDTVGFDFGAYLPTSSAVPQ